MFRHRKPLFGMGLFVLFALVLLLGIRHGKGAVRRFGLEPRIQQPLSILMYHKVVPDGEPCNDMRVTVSKLREDFQYLRDLGCTPVLPRDLLSGEPLPRRPVMLTFDDGYADNYTLLFPLLQEFQYKALICPIVTCTDNPWASDFCRWDAYREMDASGLVEIGSHTYALHNLENGGAVYDDGTPNGIQRLEGETDAAFRVRVLEDLQKSYDRLTEELGHAPLCFAYPYGAKEPDAQSLIDELFPVSLLTWPDTADLANGTIRMPRWTVNMYTPLSYFIRYPSHFVSFFGYLNET